MSTLCETVAQIIGVHEAWQRPDRTWECACGKAFGLKIKLDYHVAEAVLAAVGGVTGEPK